MCIGRIISLQRLVWTRKCWISFRWGECCILTMSAWFIHIGLKSLMAYLLLTVTCQWDVVIWWKCHILYQYSNLIYATETRQMFPVLSVIKWLILPALEHTADCEVSNTHTHIHPFNGPLSRTTRVSWYQKGKTNLDFLLKQEIVSGSGISWATCKSAPRSRQITTPAPHHSVFTGRMPFLPPNQQRQSTEVSNQ